ncbi:endonuclease/exonuclease/phosphatase family protein, partial [Candidatus Sumerlaeota bacterium]|nr:endonuclease/exonuclease/phosphatase family protein [Candidatus Sumerlaeota bacterium]
MKSLSLARRILALLFLPLISIRVCAEPVTLRVMTFNLRYASNTPPNAWPGRRPVLKNTILTSDADIVGTQEGLWEQLKDIAEDLPGYAWIGEGRNGGSKGEFMAIFYKRARFDPAAYGHFWLSDTPDVIGSHTWGNTLPRMVTWVLFRDKTTGAEFYHWNTHFDHQSQPAREKRAELLISRVRAQQPVHPVVLTGDFNQGQENIVHQTMTGKAGGALNLADSWEIAEKHEGTQIGTWNGWKGPSAETQRIDWILLSPEFKCLSSQVVLYK